MTQRPDLQARWRAYGKRMGWPIRPAPWWRRLPIIRLIRSYRYMHAIVVREEMFGEYAGDAVPRDVWTFHGVFHGWL